LKTFASVGTYAQKKPDVFHYKIENKWRSTYWA
jgi:hypothetical protein